MKNDVVEVQVRGVLPTANGCAVFIGNDDKCFVIYVDHSVGAAITMFDSRVRLSQSILEELYKYFPNKIFRSVIPRTVRLAEAPSFGQAISTYDPGSKAASAYERLAREMIEAVELRLKLEI